MKVAETMATRPPADCSCIWTHWDSGGAVHIADKDCPARPHPRTYEASPQQWHPADHRPDWRARGGETVCAECGHAARVFKCRKCGEQADEATIGHGSFSAGGGTHYPERPTR